MNFGFYSEQMYLKSLPEFRGSMKEMYLSFKAEYAVYKLTKNDSNDAPPVARVFKSGMSGRVMGISSQVEDDYLEILKLFYDRATTRVTGFVMNSNFIKM